MRKPSGSCPPRPSTPTPCTSCATCGASRPYTLDEKSEQIINIKDENGMSAVMTLYSMLTNRLEFTMVVDGETRKLTRDELTGFAFSPQPEQRAAAYQELYRVYAAEATILGQIYINRVRDWHDEHVGLRGYSSPISVRNEDNDIPDEAVEVLLAVARENAPLFQRYFRLKAGWIGQERLRRYDIYAPLATSDRKIAYPDARALGARDLQRVPPAVLADGRAGLRRRPHRQRDPQGQARRRVLLDNRAEASPPGCWSTTPAACATWRRSPTSSDTRSTA